MTPAITPAARAASISATLRQMRKAPSEARSIHIRCPAMPKATGWATPSGIIAGSSTS